MSVRTQAGSSVRDHAWEASSGKNNRNGHQCASHFSIKASLKTRTLILKRSTKYAGKYVAVVNETLVAVGDSGKEGEDKARAIAPEKIPSVLSVLREEDMACLLKNSFLPCAKGISWTSLLSPFMRTKSKPLLLP